MESRDTTGPQQESPSRTASRKRVIVGGAIALGLAAGVFWIAGPARQLGQWAPYAGRAPTFTGKSDQLKQTVIVPTLDSPCPPGKNVIWCSSFQLAWNELRDNVIHAPLQVIGAEEIAARLNAAKQSSSDLDPKSFYIAGGWTKDGIVDKIKKDMAARFPSHPLPDFNGLQGGILAYSYLTANVPFKYPFEQVEKGFAFTDSQGGKTQVDGFGLSESHQNGSRKIRQQVEILYSAFQDRGFEVRECAIDLCKYSRPYQVVVAMVEPKGSLAQTLEYVRARTDRPGEAGRIYARGEFRSADILEVPEMVWRIDHRFSELIGKVLVNVKMPITEAMQTIEFRLGRAGAKVESEARLPATTAAPMHFVFDRPFLVYMQKRGAEQSFFVMWVDNAELLVRR
jgi:hypothetical protein